MTYECVLFCKGRQLEYVWVFFLDNSPIQEGLSELPGDLFRSTPILTYLTNQYYITPGNLVKPIIVNKRHSYPELKDELIEYYISVQRMSH